MRYTFAIGIPTVNRADLLNQALRDLADYCPAINIYIIDNGNQAIDNNGHENVYISRPENNIGVAASWNRLCNSIFNNHDIAIIINDDVSWQKFQEDIQLFLNREKDMNMVCTNREMCLFAISKKTYTLVGQFDEKFYPAYFEDNDYLYRMKLKGISKKTSSFFDPAVYRNSMSIEKDSSLNLNFMKNRERYIEKWGGLPGQEVYQKAFDAKGL